MIGAVVLAAGESKRMGVPKLLLPYRGTTIIESVLAGVTASRVDATWVVLGCGRRPIREKVRKFPVSVAVNTRFREGMLSSIQKGISSLPRSFRVALIVLGDQPDISPTVIDALIEAWETKQKGIVVPAFGGRQGHPLLLDLKYRTDIAGLCPGTGLRGLVASHPDDLLAVDLPAPEILVDIDTPEDYRKALIR